jgi:hypothetical protein
VPKPAGATARQLQVEGNLNLPSVLRLLTIRRNPLCTTMQAREPCLQHAALLPRCCAVAQSVVYDYARPGQPVPRETVAISTRRHCGAPLTQAETPLCVGRPYRHPSQLCRRDDDQHRIFIRRGRVIASCACAASASSGGAAGAGPCRAAETSQAMTEVASVWLWNDDGVALLASSATQRRTHC